MQSEKGIEIERIHPGGEAEHMGLCPGDALVSVNSHILRDPIDFLFYSSDDAVEIKVMRHGEYLTLHTVRKNGMDFGIEFKSMRALTCKNNCIFCFVNQLPKGLRKTLYIKDDDYRMSFLYGNYITLTNLQKEDRNRIIEQRLSPLYISVHSTCSSVRNRLLSNAKAPDILKEIKFLADHRIRLHTQIVLCPGYNDGKELRKTISDLCLFYPYVLSIAVVPVGLTSYRRLTLRAVEKEDARDAVKIIESFQKRVKKKHGEIIVYGADELYIKAGIPFPPLEDYGDFPQIENGVGMVPLFLHEAKKLKIPETFPRKKKFLTFTGVSFYPFLRRFIRLLEGEGLTIELVPVKNNFFGTSVTVAGLLTGKDVIKTLFDKIEGHEALLVPDVVFKEGEEMFLDDITLKDMEEALGIPVKKIKSSPQGLIRGIMGEKE